MLLYFEEKRDKEGKLQIRQQWKDWYVTYEPADVLTDRNARRQELVAIRTYKTFLVVIAVLLGVYSYLAIAKDITTEVAVQDGMKVLKVIGPQSWCLFAAYNITVLLYYSNWFISTIKSGYDYILIILFCKCCRAFDNQRLETTFKPTWDMTEPKKKMIAL